MLIQTNDLREILDNSRLLIIDARSYKEYAEGHIPGAVNLDLFSFHWFDTSAEGISQFDIQAKKLLSFAGVTSKKKVVFYDDCSGMLAARGVWMLMYFSHSDSYMLDGGYSKWKREGHPTESKPNPFVPSSFEGVPNPQLITGFEYIRKNLHKLKIIDARTSDEFDGTSVRAAQRGHIPTSININWENNLRQDGSFKSLKELEQIYDLPKNSEIVTYCHGAYRAANTFLVLKLIGFSNVKVYLGSWGEWGNKTGLPTEL